MCNQCFCCSNTALKLVRSSFPVCLLRFREERRDSFCYRNVTGVCVCLCSDRREAKQLFFFSFSNGDREKESKPQTCLNVCACVRAHVSRYIWRWLTSVKVPLFYYKTGQHTLINTLCIILQRNEVKIHPSIIEVCI